MRNTKKLLSFVLAALMLFSCVAVSASAEDVSYIGITGELSVLNFNVDGLPIPPSETEDGKDAYLDTIEIGQKLNAMKYDIVAVQEDFNYDQYMRDVLKNYKDVKDADGNVIERHGTVHSGGIPLGDGLNVFSTYALYNEDRIDWEVSAGIITDGSDELTYNGILLTTIELAPGYYLDIYDVHCDADGGEDSVAARAAQYEQLAKVIKKRSVYDETTGTYDHAVIVMGDINTSLCTENAEGVPYLLKNLVEAADLNDAWALQTLSEITENPADYSAYYDYAKNTDLNYSEAQGHYDSAERIMFADGNGINLTSNKFGYFYVIGADGESLSDHCAAEGYFTFEIVEKVQDFGGNHDGVETTESKSFLIQFLEYIASLFRALGKLLQDWANWGTLA